MSKSAVTWFRKKVLGPGKSQHNGRGAYEMETSLSYQDLVRTMESLQGYKDVEKFEIDKDGVAHLTLVQGFGCQVTDTWRLYATLRVGFYNGKAWAIVS